jgi:2-(1,2-epoxy-1,2-dihydrophenyl)acetyl-CoA isomerase
LELKVIESPYLKITKQDATLIISINRPEVYNALNADSKSDIVKAIKAANKDPKFRSIVLTGEGKAFCSGQDLNDRNIQSDAGPVDLGNTLETEWIPLVSAISDSDIPVVGAINGVCAGAGLSVALACDLIVAKPGLKFVSGFSKLGLTPDAGATFAFTKALGKAKTMEFFFFNKPLMAEDMVQHGLINQISDTPLDSAVDYAAKINQLAPKSVRFMKKNVILAQEEIRSEMLARETAAQRQLGNSKDYQEGLKAFFEKRAPNFQGE